MIQCCLLPAQFLLYTRNTANHHRLEDRNMKKISSVLLGIVAYFIRQLHSDFRKMGENLSEVKTTGLLIRSDRDSVYRDPCVRT